MGAFFKSILVAGLGGSIAAVTAVVSTGQLSLKVIGTTAAVGAASAIAALFHPSPSQTAN